MKLYSYFRSSAAYRVRIACALKGIAPEIIPVHLVNNGGEQHHQAYTQINPQELVPTLIHDTTALSQSLAIIEYIEEQYPAPSLLPSDTVQRAYVRQIANMIACDIHPLNNLRVLNYLKGPCQLTEEVVRDWYQHWVVLGLEAVEHIICDSAVAGDCCWGDHPSMAECCLIPQVYNAIRFDCDLNACPNIKRIYEFCLTLDAFVVASPEQQVDAPT